MHKGVRQFRQYADQIKSFEMRDEAYYANLAAGHGRYLPHNRKLVFWMANEDNRDLLAEVIAAGRRAFNMRPVGSNRELLDRIQEYFSIVQGRRVPPTMEEFSLYMGYNSQYILSLIHETSPGFPDIGVNGLTTAQILLRAVEVIHNADAVQSMRRMSDVSTYIFRSKNYYGMKDTRETPITITFQTPDALPPEQIVQMLPDLAPDRSMEGVEVI